MFIESCADDDIDFDDFQDVEEYNVYAAHRQRPPRRPFDPSLSIPSDGYSGMSRDFKSVWTKEDVASKKAPFSSIRNSSASTDSPKTPTTSSLSFCSPTGENNHHLATPILWNWRMMN